MAVTRAAGVARKEVESAGQIDRFALFHDELEGVARIARVA
jgi:hypothetical protein